MHRALAAPIVALLAVVLTACGTHKYPDVSVTSIRPYTSLELAAAGKQIAQTRQLAPPQGSKGTANLSSVAAEDLRRYLTTKSSDYADQRLRMDEMLDGKQQVLDAFSSLFRAYQIAASFSPGGSEAAELPPLSAPGTDPGAIENTPEVVEARGKLEASNVKLSEAEEKQEKADNELTEEQSKLDTLENTVETKEDEHKQAKDAANNSDQKKDVDRLAGEIAQLNRQKTRAEAEMDVLIRKRKQDEQRLQQLQKNGAPQAEIDDAKNDLDRSTAEENAKQEEINRLELDLASANFEKSEADAALKRLTDEAGKKEKELEDATKKRDDQQNIVKEKETNATTAEGTTKTAQADVAKEQIALNKAIATAQAGAKARDPFGGLRDAFTGTVIDSPFDVLDRAHNFYSMYVLKLLRLQPDALSYDRGDAADLSTGDAQRITSRAKERPILAVLRLNIEPGRRRNYAVSWRFNITGAMKTDGTPATGDELAKIRVISQVPTRTYDVSDQTFQESIQTSIDLALAASIPNSGVNARARAVRQQRQEQRQNFLSRIGKIETVAKKGFGWRFSPTNLSVRRPTTGERLSGALKGIQTGPFIVDASLDGGGREVAIQLGVPWDIQSLTLSQHVDYDYVGEFKPLNWAYDGVQEHGSLILQLPEPTLDEIALLVPDLDDRPQKNGEPIIDALFAPLQIIQQSRDN